MKNHILTYVGFMAAVLAMVLLVNATVFGQCKPKESVLIGLGWSSTYTACDKNVVKNTLDANIAQHGYFPTVRALLDADGTLYSEEFEAEEFGDPGNYVETWYYYNLSSKYDHKIKLEPISGGIGGLSFYTGSSYTVEYYAEQPD